MKKNRIKRVLTRSRYLFDAGKQSLKTEGVWKTAKRVTGKLFRRYISARAWMKRPIYTEKQLQEQRNRVFDRDITFSIITPLYNTSAEYLCEMIESVQAQTYGKWELCRADGSDENHDDVRQICLAYAEQDSRIRYRKLPENKGIAGNSNECIGMASGEYVSLLDHDDILHPAALYCFMEAISERGADFLYTDEATFRNSDTTDILSIHMKPDFAPDNLLSNNYICHFTSFKRELLDQSGLFRDGYDWSQDHELFLRLTCNATSIVHVPKVLYMWRAYGESTAEDGNNKPYATISGIKAVGDYLRARGIDARVEQAKGIPSIYRVSYALPEDRPKVGIIIPNRDHTDDLKACISSVIGKTTYDNYEIIIVENGSTEESVFEYYDEITGKDARVKKIDWPGEFNWSAINNHAARKTDSEYLLLLNNDTEIITPEWIEEMLMHAGRPEIGVVGALLYYPNDSVQHGGVILGLGGIAGHAFAGAERGSRGYAGKLCYTNNVSAVTGACMLMRREIWESVGGFDEEFAVGLNDIDFCLRVRKAGYRILLTPFAELYHYESKSRGKPDTAEKKAAANREIELLRTKWAKELEAGDPYYNPNLSLKCCYRLKDRKREG
ncbi:MAG: glycosyltransferase family 2 protein [Lachnospiraceae bacterium]|nr:glycosyltransferase family 2 protein [Lachnospiraceae bacterium]